LAYFTFKIEELFKTTIIIIIMLKKKACQKPKLYSGKKYKLEKTLLG